MNFTDLDTDADPDAHGHPDPDSDQHLFLLHGGQRRHALIDSRAFQANRCGDQDCQQAHLRCHKNRSETIDSIDLGSCLNRS